MVIHRETSRQSDESPGVGWFPKSGRTPTFPSLGLRVLRGRQWGWSGEGSCDAPRRHYKTSAAIYRPCRPQRALGLAVPPSLPPSPCLALAGGGEEQKSRGRAGKQRCAQVWHSRAQRDFCPSATEICRQIPSQQINFSTLPFWPGVLFSIFFFSFLFLLLCLDFFLFLLLSSPWPQTLHSFTSQFLPRAWRGGPHC